MRERQIKKIDVGQRIDRAAEAAMPMRTGDETMVCPQPRLAARLETTRPLSG